MFSPLDIKQYAPLNDTGGQSKNYGRTVGGLYSNPGPQPYVVTETTRTIPEELIALKEGARVTSADEKHVGNVEQVYTDPDSGKVTHFIISQGLLTKTRKSVPIQWVNMIDEKEVYLTVGAKEVEDLPAEES